MRTFVTIKVGTSSAMQVWPDIPYCITTDYSTYNIFTNEMSFILHGNRPKNSVQINVNDDKLSFIWKLTKHRLIRQLIYIREHAPYNLNKVPY